MYKTLVSTENLSHEDWLLYRRLGIGGSDLSVLCGINQYKSPIELWAEKTDKIPSKEAGEAAYWGNQLEPFVVNEFVTRTGIEVKKLNAILQSETHEFMLANLDGICEHPTLGTCIFEAKTTSVYNSKLWEDSIPDEYMLQIQHYMSVTGFKGTYIAVLIGGNKFKWKFIERDEELISMIIELEKDFWDNVTTDTPPNVDSLQSTEEFLSTFFPTSIPESKFELPESAMQIIGEYKEASDKISEYTDKKRLAENKLKQMLQDNEIGIIGNQIISWKTVTQERLDSKSLKIEHPKIYKKYANLTSHRRFSIKEAIIQTKEE